MRMSSLLDTQDAADAARYRKVIARTLAMLEAYASAGERFVSIEEVRDLLGADPDAAPQAPRPDPAADPVTGCLPVTPPGPR